MSGNNIGNIQVHVAEIRQLFNSMDPSPFRERDLDPDCEEFIVSWAREFPAERPLHIAIGLDQPLADAGLRQRLPMAVQGHFQREAELQGLRLRRSLREGRVSLAIGLVFLTVCTLTAGLFPGDRFGPFAGILSESLIIAGWVAMWRPMEVLLYGLWPLFRERRLLERLACADISVHAPSQDIAHGLQADA